MLMEIEGLTLQPNKQSGDKILFAKHSQPEVATWVNAKSSLVENPWYQCCHDKTSREIEMCLMENWVVEMLRESRGIENETSPDPNDEYGTNDINMSQVGSFFKNLFEWARFSCETPFEDILVIGNEEIFSFWIPSPSAVGTTTAVLGTTGLEHRETVRVKKKMTVSSGLNSKS